MDVPNFVDRCVYLRFQLDANRINARQKIPAINQLEQWHRDRVIELFMSEIAFEEAFAGTDRRRREKTMAHYYSETAITASDERRRMLQIEQAIFPGGARTQNDRNDVEIVFNADKYHALLVTNDGGSRSQPGGILGARDAVGRLGIRVLTGEEAVALVREQIVARDEHIREGCRRFNVPLPEWVARD